MAISRDEITEVLKFGESVSKEVLDEFFGAYDKGGDGEIQFEEFKQMMTKLQ
jgi:Ca2+-binding EF-hand superfamily protein